MYDDLQQNMKYCSVQAETRFMRTGQDTPTISSNKKGLHYVVFFYYLVSSSMFNL